jgi:general secretion pathway protein H
VSRQRGFTMLELLAAVTIVGLLLAVAVPASARFYESMQYRQAVRDVITALASARYSAVNSGRARDVSVDPAANTVEFDGKRTRLPDALDVAIHSTRELNRDRLGVIRFYPEGGSSGGDIDLERDDGTGVRISVDWLIGRVSQETYAPD